VLQAVREDAPKALAEICPDVSQAMIAICGKAMARDPRQRYESMTALADDLERYLAGKTVVVDRPGGGSDAGRRRGPVALAIALTATRSRGVP
jgi:hypothetical protein